MSSSSTAALALADELRALSTSNPSLRARLDAAGFDEARLLRLASTLGGANAASERDARNRVTGEVRAPESSELLAMPAPGSVEEMRLRAIGAAAIADGKLAFCVMAGGMATRMGGVVKALVEALPGKTFLDLRLGENRSASGRARRPVPLWLMTSDATDHGIKQALSARRAPSHVKVFTQDLGLRLTPEGHLFRDASGAPSTYATGHGDLVDAIRRAGLVKEFLANGGEHVWIANLDNLGASIDEVVLGRFIESQKEVMVEVCPKAPGDKGGIPVHAMGRLQVLEEFRLPKGFDAAQVRVFNTNTFLVRAKSLQNAPIEWSWFFVEKKVDGRAAIQFERLLQELTSALPSAYLEIPRDGAGSRFLPVKDHDELARRRDEITRVAEARKMI